MSRLVLHIIFFTNIHQSEDVESIQSSLHLPFLHPVHYIEIAKYLLQTYIFLRISIHHE